MHTVLFKKKTFSYFKCSWKKYFIYYNYITLNSQQSIIRSVEKTHIISNEFAAWHVVSDSVAETEVLGDMDMVNTKMMEFIL